MKQKLKNFTLLGFDRSFSKGLKSQFIWLAGIMCFVYITLTGISYAGEMYAIGKGGDKRLLDILLVLIAPGPGSEAMSSTLTIVCSILGLTIFSGMLISVISNVLERRVERYKKGETNYKINNHVIILGFNKGITSLVEQILDIKYKEEDPYIIIMCNRNIEKTRDWLHANISNQYEDNIILMNGVRNAIDDIDRLRLKHGVKEIFILGEEDETDHDTISMECARNIAIKLNQIRVNSKIKCYVQLNSLIMFSALQKTEINKTIKEHLVFEPFNFNEIWAQKAIVTIPNEDYKSLDGIGITRNSNKHVHLIIVGMNPLSWSLAVNAAHILHFPNFKEGVFNTCSTITFIDAEATLKGKEFRRHYRNLFDLARWREVFDYQCMDTNRYWIDPITDGNSDSPYKKYLGPVNFMDIQWEFIEGNVFDKNIQDYVEHIATEDNTIGTIALCEEESDKNTSICMSLSEATRLSANEILVRQDESDIVVKTLRKVYGFNNVHAFGMMNECYKENLISDKYGKIINASYSGCTFDGSEDDNKKIESEWDKITSIDKWSSIYCANMLFYKLRSLGLDTSKEISIEEINKATSEINHDIIQLTEHNRWNTERLLLGMRPLYSDEFDIWWNNWKDKDKKEMRPEKEKMKSQMKHIDICSNNLLEKVDKPAVSFDTMLNKKMASIYKCFMRI